MLGVALNKFVIIANQAAAAERSFAPQLFMASQISLFKTLDDPSWGDRGLHNFGLFFGGEKKEDFVAEATRITDEEHGFALS